MHLKAKTLCTYLSIDSFEASGMSDIVQGRTLYMLFFGQSDNRNNIRVVNWLTRPIYIVFRVDYSVHDYIRVDIPGRTQFKIKIGSFLSKRCTAEVNQYVNGDWVALGEIHFHLKTNDDDRFDIKQSGLFLNGKYRNEQSQTWKKFLET